MRKQEFPPLLSAGFHIFTLPDLRKLCVDRFPLSTRRPALMENLELICKKLCEAGVVADLWIDGSFLTESIDPADIDCCLRCDSAFYETAPKETQAAIQWLYSNLKTEYNCDSYSFWTGRKVTMPPTGWASLYERSISGYMAYRSMAPSRESL